jgi:hypothetical protein
VTVLRNWWSYFVELPGDESAAAELLVLFGLVAMLVWRAWGAVTSHIPPRALMRVFDGAIGVLVVLFLVLVVARFRGVN